MPAALLSVAACVISPSLFAEVAEVTAHAGGDFSVNEGDTAFLGGGGGDGTPALHHHWTQIGGTPVALAGTDTAAPFFIAPDVAAGGETLSFLLTAASGASAATDVVNVTVVNRNHPPVAYTGDDQTVAVGAHVTLGGEDSFDIDNDPFTHTWIQTDGPEVALTGADGANPSFIAPDVDGVATLTFRLRVDDGYPLDAPAPGHVFDDVIDTVTIVVTETNNPPTAYAGVDRTVDEKSEVSLSAAGSYDPDGDALTFSWVQEAGGIPVVLKGAETATPSFAAPSVSGNTPLVFTLTVDDGYGGSDRATIRVNVLDSDSTPLAAAARPTVSELWPPNHGMVPVGITGIAGDDADVDIKITGVTQDEPTTATGEGDTPIDAIILADGTALLRAERSGEGDGRVYHIHFTATNATGSSSGTVGVAVPLTREMAVFDGGRIYDSTR